MMHRTITFFKKKERQISAAACVIFGLSLALGCAYTDHQSQTSIGTGTGDPEVTEAFDVFLDQIFINDVKSNLINLHYTIADPEAYGIDDYEITLGSASTDSLAESYATMENTLAQLEQFPYDSLSGEQQLTYDILQDYLEMELSAADYTYYDEILRPSTGTQAQLPVLYVEYAFRDLQDVDDYLQMIALTDEYFDEIIAFEQAKADKGLFMPDYACDTIIAQCEDFVENPDEHYLIETFNEKIDAFPNLNDTEKDTYKIENETLVKEHVIAAYENLAEALKELRGSGTNEQGLCYFPDGTDYYEYLVYAATGSSMNLDEMKDAIAKQRSADLNATNNLISDNPDLWEQANEADIEISEPSAMLETLQSAMLADFPAAPETNFTINYVADCMEEYMAPAFYITSPIDDYTNNSIYINLSSNYTNTKLFTTLAHEGYPGHLYQTVMTHSAGIAPVRSLLNYSGYVEGWATYVEMKSYHYAGFDEDIATLMQLNQTALLSLYATTDIGIHYDGWSLAETTTFWNNYGISDSDTIESIYELIEEEPAHYLEYYVGYLEFLNLKNEMQHTYFHTFNEKAFHLAIVNIGPAPFSIVEKYLPSYYEAAVTELGES